MFADPAELMTNGKTGLWIVDQFLESERYAHANLPTITVSPDSMPRSWKTG